MFLRAAGMQSVHHFSHFRDLNPRDRVRHMDFIEDLDTGRYEPVTIAGPYSFLLGERVSEVRKLPYVNDVVTPVWR